MAIEALLDHWDVTAKTTKGLIGHQNVDIWIMRVR